MEKVGTTYVVTVRFPGYTSRQPMERKRIDGEDRISERRDLTARPELPIDALNRIVELTRGRAVKLTSPLPRTPRLHD